MRNDFGSILRNIAKALGKLIKGIFQRGTRHSIERNDSKEELPTEVTYRLVLHTAHDERVCPHCARLEGMRINLNVSSESDIHRVISQHPNCRCPEYTEVVIE